jgi:hypothetical protein
MTSCATANAVSQLVTVDQQGNAYVEVPGTTYALPFPDSDPAAGPQPDDNTDAMLYVKAGPQFGRRSVWTITAANTNVSLNVDATATRLVHAALELALAHYTDGDDPLNVQIEAVDVTGRPVAIAVQTRRALGKNIVVILSGPGSAGVTAAELSYAAVESELLPGLRGAIIPHTSAPVVTVDVLGNVTVEVDGISYEHDRQGQTVAFALTAGPAFDHGSSLSVTVPGQQPVSFRLKQDATAELHTLLKQADAHCSGEDTKVDDEINASDLNGEPAHVGIWHSLIRKGNIVLTFIGAASPHEEARVVDVELQHSVVYDQFLPAVRATILPVVTAD